MSPLRPLFFIALLGGSGLVAYQLASKPNDSRASRQSGTAERGPDRPDRAGRSRQTRPLLLAEAPLQQVDPTNYEVTVSDLALQETGEKIQGDSRSRLEELTHRYQLSANQRRETFPLLVSHHPAFTGGLVVNGFAPPDPGAGDFASQFSAILNLNQQELFQEDLGADRAWWRDVLVQIREDLEGSRLPHGEPPGEAPPGQKAKGTQSGLDALFGD